MPARKRPRTYHHGDLREALVAAAIALLEEKGLSGFTLRQCARRAGVSHAAPAHHFATADDLLAEIAARGFERFVAALGKAADQAEGSPLARLEAMGRAYVAFALANPAVYGLMFRLGAGSLASPHLKTASRAAWQQLCDSVAAVLGEKRQSEVNAKAAAVWALVHGTATLLLDRKLPPGIAESMDPAAAILPSLPGLLRPT
ncbi:TetR/AcrR family transcriptional regulator [Taklimakanibacter deserti]|uniref:TetR/AcrR family transcriptional regulator n=1 Tax=Taklimakanibacter deserti TaxID=2267839 RepID=UPI0013C4323B